jgi:hypothetical protein
MNKSLRALADHVRCCPSATPREQAAARAALSQRRAPAKVKAESVAFAERRQAETDEGWRAFKTWVRATVWELSAGYCEHCGKPLLNGEGDLDHARGGSSRDAYTRIAWTRRLCHRPCHQPNRTKNIPSAAFWLTEMQRINVARLALHGPDRISEILTEEYKRLETLALNGCRKAQAARRAA